MFTWVPENIILRRFLHEGPLTLPSGLVWCSSWLKIFSEEIGNNGMKLRKIHLSKFSPNQRVHAIVLWTLFVIVFCEFIYFRNDIFEDRHCGQNPEDQILAFFLLHTVTLPSATFLLVRRKILHRIHQSPSSRKQEEKNCLANVACFLFLFCLGFVLPCISSSVSRREEMWFRSKCAHLTDSKIMVIQIEQYL